MDLLLGIRIAFGLGRISVAMYPSKHTIPVLVASPVLFQKSPWAISKSFDAEVPHAETNSSAFTEA